MLVARGSVALSAGDDRFGPPHKCVAVPEVLSARLHAITPRLRRSRLSEVGRLQLVITSIGASQDNSHKLRWLRPSILHEPANATTVYSSSKDNLVTRTRGYAGAVTDDAIIPHLLHDYLAPSAVSGRDDAVDERCDSRVDMGG